MMTARATTGRARRAAAPPHLVMTATSQPQQEPTGLAPEPTGNDPGGTPAHAPGPQLVRGHGASRRAAPQWLAGFLSVPLLWKIVGANTLVVLGAAGAIQLLHAAPATGAVGILWVALAAMLVINTGLVWLALRPLAQLEEAAGRVWRGDFTARVAPSATADRDMARVGNILNLLLDGLTGDRSRMRLLASQIISAQDAERSRIARELHDGVAQTLAAAKLQIQALVHDELSMDKAMLQRLDTLRDLVTDALEELRSLSHSIYPRVLDDLGLVAALEWLSRQTREATAVDVRVESDLVAPVPPSVAAVLYRVAQEGLRNAVVHARAGTIVLRVEADAQHASLEVMDDGIGFDLREAESRRPGMGLFAMRERMALAGGSVDIHSVVGRGTRVTATVPLTSTTTET